jgi:spermidine synthase
VRSLAVQAQSFKAVHVVSLGCCAIIAQSIFIRELMPLFTGTEFVVGALLAFWLFWVGAGALLGGRAAETKRISTPGLFARLAVMLAVLLPATVVAIRFGRGMLARPPGALPSPGGAIAFACLVTAPFGFAYGVIYNAASALWREREGGMRGGIARVYLWEAAGSVFGAVLFSFALVATVSQFQAALVAAGLLVMMTALSGTMGRRRAELAAAALAVVFIVAAVSPAIDRKTVEAIYPGYTIDDYFFSRYGEIVVTERAGMKTVFSGGGRVFSSPEPERCEETIHIPLLLCAEPRSILLVGSSLGGGLAEALKHPSVERIDCVELDGSLFRTDELGGGRGAAVPREFEVPGGRGPDGERRVRVIATDGRSLVARAEERYDCVILSSPAPVNLQWNRFYTREFFEAVRRTLRPGGVFAFTHASSENMLSAEQATILRILERTLESAFKRVRVLPGTTAHFIASESDIDPSEILPRLRARGIDAPFVSEDYLPFRLTEERTAGLRLDLDRAGDPPVNTDVRPVLPLHELLLDGSRTGSRLVGVFRALFGVPPAAIGAIFTALLAGLFALARFGPLAGPRTRAALAVWGVGLGSFLIQVLVLLSYQSFSGILYTGIVLLTALFMAGAAGGAFVSIRRERWGRGSIRAIHVGFIMLAAAPPLWATVLRKLSISSVAGSLPFFIIAGCAGALTGAYYGIVVRTAFPETGGRAPAAFYAWDMFGACLGGLLGGVVLFPTVGLAGTALCIALMHGLALAFVAGRW